MVEIISTDSYLETWVNKGGASAPLLITTIIFMKEGIQMPIIIEPISIHLDSKNVARLKEFKDYKANKYTEHYWDQLRLMDIERDSFSRPAEIDVVLQPTHTYPIKDSFGKMLHQFDVFHNIKWGSNGHQKSTTPYTTSSQYTNGIAYLYDDEIDNLRSATDVEYFFTLFGEAEKNDN